VLRIGPDQLSKFLPQIVALGGINVAPGKNKVNLFAAHSVPF